VQVDAKKKKGQHKKRVTKSSIPILSLFTTHNPQQKKKREKKKTRCYRLQIKAAEAKQNSLIPIKESRGFFYELASDRRCQIWVCPFFPPSKVKLGVCMCIGKKNTKLKFQTTWAKIEDRNG
jgi:hypothetical protein